MNVAPNRGFRGQAICWCHWHLQGAPKNNDPLGKIRHLWNWWRFFRQIYSIYRGRSEPHILRILLQYLVAFKNYNYLNLNVHFLKWTSH